MITILSAIFILFKGDIALIQNAYFSNIDIGKNAFQSGLPPGLLFFIITGISFVAYICSQYSLRILRGSDFWIDFYEGKLRAYEKETSEIKNIDSLIFGDHPTYLKKQIDEIRQKLSDPPFTIQNNEEGLSDFKRSNDEEIEKLKQMYTTHIEKGYISTRKNMRGFIKTIVGIWSIAFVFSGTAFVLCFVNIFFESKIFDFSILTLTVSVIAIGIFAGIIYSIHWYLIRHDKKENEDYILSSPGKNNGKN
jgi:hypothetical protein